MIKERELFSKIKNYLTSPEAIIVTGMRRTGKTSLLQFIFNRIRSENKFFLDLENPANRKYFETENYENIRTYLEVLGGDFHKKSYLFIDEIQHVKNLPSVVKYFIDHYKVKFFLTGSASFYLKNLFSESLAGRKYIFELFPLTFREFLEFKNSPIKIPRSSEAILMPIFNTIAPLYEEYLQYGGFPGVVFKKNAKEKKRAIEEIFSSFFQLEVIQLGGFRRNNVIRDLMLLLIDRTGSKLDIQKLAKELKISRQTVYEYISFLESTYFIKLIRPFTKNRDAEIRKMPKVYLCDSGLANQIGKVSEGSLFENNVFQNLRTIGDLNYYQKKNGLEIDFIINKKKGYEVKINPTEHDLKRLSAFAKELGLEEHYIISKNYSALKNIKYAFTL